MPIRPCECSHKASFAGLPRGDDGEIGDRVPVDTAKLHDGCSLVGSVMGQSQYQSARFARENECAAILWAGLAGIYARNRYGASENARCANRDIIHTIVIDVTCASDRQTKIAGRRLVGGRLALRPVEIVRIAYRMQENVARARNQKHTPLGGRPHSHVRRAVAINVAETGDRKAEMSICSWYRIVDSDSSRGTSTIHGQPWDPDGHQR